VKTLRHALQPLLSAQLQALKKYAKAYDIPYHPSTGKEDLAGLISRHWEKMVRSAGCCPVCQGYDRM